MFRLIVILSLLVTASCKRLKPQPKNDIIVAPFLSTSSLYIKDNTDDFKSKSLFETIEWSTYDFFGGHIIWSNLDIYVVNTGRETFYFQIEDFYNPDEAAGISNPKNFALFKVNSMVRNNITTTTIDAYACGAAQADAAGYAACQADPERNQFTYFNLQTLNYWRMTDAEAQKRTDWHIAFKDFEIIINNGVNGPGRNLAGLAYRNQNFFTVQGDEIVPNLDLIKDTKISGQALSYFDRITSNVRYFLPKGENRVIHESDWYKKNSQGEKEVVDNSWIIKSIEGNSFFKFSVDEINEFGDEAEISFSLNYQGPQSFEFDPVETIYKLPPVKEGTAIEYCIDLDNGQIGCSNFNWDIRFEATTSGEWYLWTHNGAIPLADKQLALSLNSAL